ncbi:MAG: c-type cytochrome [Arenicella sp.]
MSEQPMSDNKFSRNFIGMIIAMTVLTAILMVLATINAGEVNERLRAEKDAERTPSIVEQIAPIGKVAIGTVANAVPEAQAQEVSGETVYNAACVACHSSGVAGAPIVGKAEQWTARLGKGQDTLYDSAINGLGAMPARGGQSLSDDEVKAAVDYMVQASQ